MNMRIRNRLFTLKRADGLFPFLSRHSGSYMLNTRKFGKVKIG